MNNQFDDILKRYEAARSAGSSIYLEPDDLTDIAEYYMTREREQDADKVIRLALALHPDSVELAPRRRELRTHLLGASISGHSE